MPNDREWKEADVDPEGGQGPQRRGFSEHFEGLDDPLLRDNGGERRPRHGPGETHFRSPKFEHPRTRIWGSAVQGLARELQVENRQPLDLSLQPERAENEWEAHASTLRDRGGTPDLQKHRWRSCH